MPRRTNRPEARQQKDGLWHIYVTVGKKPDGTPKQRHIKRKTKTAAEKEADRVIAALDNGKLEKTGKKPTVESWMTTYLTTIATQRCNEDTLYDYESKMRNWVYPQYGKKRIGTLEPEDLDAIYEAMRRAGKAPSHQLKVHRILSRALDIALRRGHVVRNVAKLIDPPSTGSAPVKGLDEKTALAILRTASERRNPERWSVAMALGLRQGEALALRWTDPEDGTPLVDLDAGIIRVWWQWRRSIHRHGCGGTCGKQRAGYCPQRLGGGLSFRRCKGKSERVLPIPPELLPKLRVLKRRQWIERTVLPGEWLAGEALFTTPDGKMIDPRDDYDEWVSILRESGIQHVKLHILRHTAAMILLAQGVSMRVVQEILGHQDIRTTQAYTQGATEMMVKAVKRTVLREKKPKAKKKPKIKGVEKGVLRVVA